MRRRWWKTQHIRAFIKKRRELQNAAIARVEIERAANRVKVTLHTAKPGIIIGRGGKGVDDLRLLLEQLTKKSRDGQRQRDPSPGT